MARGKWLDRCRTSGYGLKRLEDLDELGFLDERGNLRADLFPGCDVFNISSESAEMGIPNVSRGKDAILKAIETGSLQAFPVYDVNSKLVTVAARKDNLRDVGQLVRQENKARQRSGLKQDQVTDVSPGSNAPADTGESITSS